MALRNFIAIVGYSIVFPAEIKFNSCKRFVKFLFAFLCKNFILFVSSDKVTYFSKNNFSQAEQYYIKVLNYKESRYFGWALFKLAWCYYNYEKYTCC